MIIRYAFAMIAATSAFLSTLWAMPMTDGDVTLAPPPPPKPTVLNITFGAAPNDIVTVMRNQDIPLIDQQTTDGHGVTKLLRFEGVPSGVSVQQGISQFFFFKNELIRMTFDLTPSYSNFLELRRQLLGSLGSRFVIADQKESMDTHLRMRLSSLDHATFQQESEKLINASIVEGKTFFYYKVKDKANTLVITLAYMHNHSSGGGKPSLSLHYDHNPGIDNFQAFEQQYQYGRPGGVGGSAPLTPQD